tara:strand:- start:262 stop:456 length:195 start_codon:yes stop_codon:yes gene_type:complete
MVKKIRLIDEPEAPEEIPTDVEKSSGEFLELAKSMDWKLWEMLQLLQRLEKKLIADEKNAKTKK